MNKINDQNTQQEVIANKPILNKACAGKTSGVRKGQACNVRAN